MLRIELKDEAVTAGLARLAAALSDLTPAMEEIGEVLVGSTRARFAAGAGPDGIAWAPKSPVTIAAYRRRGDSVSFKPLIGPSRTLSTTIHAVAGSDRVEVGSNKIQAAVMQAGAAQGAFGRTRRGGPVSGGMRGKAIVPSAFGYSGRSWARGRLPGWAGAAVAAAGCIASSRAFSASFSSRAFTAIALTASNSSRVTKSRSAIQRSIQLFIAVSASVRAPWATPMAFVISLDRSSNSLFGPVMARLPGRCPFYMRAGCGKLKVDFAAGLGSVRHPRRSPCMP